MPLVCMRFQGRSMLLEHWIAHVLQGRRYFIVGDFSATDRYKEKNRLLKRIYVDFVQRARIRKKPLVALISSTWCFSRAFTRSNAGISHLQKRCIVLLSNPAPRCHAHFQCPFSLHPFASCNYTCHLIHFPIHIQSSWYSSTKVALYEAPGGICASRPLKYVFVIRILCFFCSKV